MCRRHAEESFLNSQGLPEKYADNADKTRLTCKVRFRETSRQFQPRQTGKGLKVLDVYHKSFQIPHRRLGVVINPKPEISLDFLVCVARSEYLLVLFLQDSF